MPRKPEYTSQDGNEEPDEESGMASRRHRDDDSDDAGINVHAQKGAFDVANTAVREAGKNVQNFWQLLIVLILVGGMTIFAILGFVALRYVVPSHLNSIQRGYKEVAHEFGETQKVREEAHLDQVKELADTFEKTINSTIDKKDEAHTRTIQLILERDRVRNERAEFNNKVGRNGN